MNGGWGLAPPSPPSRCGIRSKMRDARSSAREHLPGGTSNPPDELSLAHAYVLPSVSITVRPLRAYFHNARGFLKLSDRFRSRVRARILQNRSFRPVPG